MRRKNIITCIVIWTGFMLASCTAIEKPVLTSVPPSITSTPSPSIAISTPSVQVDIVSRSLILWLSPEFDPEGSSVAAALLKQRLLDFEYLHPGLEIDVRIKSESKMIEMLKSTALAAPSALPDLIAVTHLEAQEAATAGYLHPIDGVSEIFQDPDWYGFARELAKVQNTEYGIPFAADSLVLVYRPAVLNDNNLNWDVLLNSGNKIVFPLTDTYSLFPLSLYLSAQGTLNEDQGTLQLNQNALGQMLSLFHNGLKSGAISPLVREITMDEGALEIFRDGDADLAVVFLSEDINSKSGNYLALPGLGNAPYSLGSGWVWSLAGSNIDNQELAAELASFLAESEFLSSWTRELNYLPPRPQALDLWDDTSLTSQFDSILQNSAPLPPDDILKIIEPILHQAVVRVMDGEQPEVVTKSVIEGQQ